ncbi:MAG: lysophospholipid acyltransferase family protein [Rhodothermia bacterium]|nr:MAG: lysophospholipid acyltransferase family protein [Rhodothermia bacterium]
MGVVYLLDRDPGKYKTGRTFRRLGAAMTRANPLWQFVITGNFPTNMRNPYLVISNHQSIADMPVLSLLPWDMKWVGKKSIFSLPIVGWMMRLSRDIPVDRTSLRSRAKVFIDSKDRLKHRVSVIIFPEGTRSPDGQIQAFSDGPFSLAIKHGVPILPLAVDGTFDALPKKSWKFRVKSDIKIHVFDPVEVTESGLRAPALRNHVRNLIVEKIASWRSVDVADVDPLSSDIETADKILDQGAAV